MSEMEIRLRLLYGSEEEDAALAIQVRQELLGELYRRVDGEAAADAYIDEWGHDGLSAFGGFSQ